MRAWLSQILIPPVLEGSDDKTRVAQLLNALLLTVLIGSLFIGLAALFLAARPELAVGPAALALLLACASWILMRRGHVEFASALALSGLWISTTIVMALSDGINSVLAMGYVTCAVIAGLLLGGRSAITVAALSLLAGLGLAQAKAIGVLPPILAIGADTAWIILAVNLGVTVSMVYLATRASSEAVKGARRSTAALEQQKADLEEMVADRTRDLEHRIMHLTAAAEVGRATASDLQLESLASRVVELLRERFHLYYAGLFLLDDGGDYAVLIAGTGEPGQAVNEQGHRVKVGGASMVSAACESQQAQCTLDVAEGSGRFDNLLLPLTRSEAAVPLLAGGRVLGALDVQSAEPAAFSEQDIAVLQLVADQVAMALATARRVSEEAELLEATGPRARASQFLASAVTTDQIVEAILTAVADTEADGCVVGRLNASLAGIVDSVTFLGEWNRYGASYFERGLTFRADVSPVPLHWATGYLDVKDSSAEPQAPEGVYSFLARVGARSLVNIPLRVNGRVNGFVSIYRTGTGDFSRVAMRLYQALVDQASVALERARLLDEARERAARERLIADVSAHMRQSLNIDTVLRTAIRDMGIALGIPRIEVRLGKGAIQPENGEPQDGTGPTNALLQGGEHASPD